MMKRVDPILAEMFLLLHGRRVYPDSANDSVAADIITQWDGRKFPNDDQIKLATAGLSLIGIDGDAMKLVAGRMGWSRAYADMRVRELIREFHPEIGVEPVTPALMRVYLGEYRLDQERRRAAECQETPPSVGLSASVREVL